MSSLKNENLLSFFWWRISRKKIYKKILFLSVLIPFSLSLSLNQLHINIIHAIHLNDFASLLLITKIYFVKSFKNIEKLYTWEFTGLKKETFPPRGRKWKFPQKKSCSTSFLLFRVKHSSIVWSRYFFIMDIKS